MKQPKEILESRALLKFCPINEWSLKIIENEELFFNIPQNWNDPFELEFKRDESKLSSSKTRGLFSFSLTELPIDTVGHGLDSLVDNTINNQLLWAHYSESHKGICFVFNQKKLRDYWEGIVDFQIVEYKDSDNELPEEPKFNFKSKDWFYENEIRAILEPNIHNNDKVNLIDSGFLVKYPISALDSIIFGCRADFTQIHKFYNRLSKKLKEENKKECIFNLVKLTKSKTHYKFKAEYIETIINKA